MRDSCKPARDAQLLYAQQSCLDEVGQRDEHRVAVSQAYLYRSFPVQTIFASVLNNLCARCESTHVVDAQFLQASLRRAAFVPAAGLPKRSRGDERDSRRGEALWSRRG